MDRRTPNDFDTPFGRPVSGTPADERPPLEMTPDGTFREPPVTPLSVQVTRVAVIVAVLAGMGAIALFALWAALVMIPIAVGAGLIAWAAMRFRQWRGRW
ncbi:MAG: hypothetical protein JSR21_13710 [Proteobacteria bacterium]|nr:hypothetical protein [Pseudomonadota bacterium]